MILYKYYPLSILNDEERFSSLLDKKFWFASTERLNDPFDLFGGQCFSKHSWLIRRFIHIIWTIISEKEKEFVYKKVSIIMLYILSEMRKYASCSFSRVPLDRLMWAHYADSHKGLCLGFEFPENEEIYKVLYMDKFPIEANFHKKESSVTLSLYLWLQENWERIYKSLINIPVSEKKIKDKETYIKSFLNTYEKFLTSSLKYDIDNFLGIQVIKPLLCIKSQEWVYEQEERMISTISYNKDGELKSWSDGTRLKEIILGCRFDKSNYTNKIYQLKRNFSSDLYQVEVKNIENFDLSIKRI